MASRRKNRGGPKPAFWHQWGPYIIAGAIILAGGILFQILRRQEPPEFLTSALYRLYLTQGDAAAAPPQNLEDEILADIVAAEQQIDLAAPGLEMESVAAALLEAQGRGVEVRVVEDALTQEDSVAAVTARLQEGGIGLRLAPAGTLGATFLVIDQQLVWTGSWELSQQGLEQDSSLVLRFDMVEVAADFHAEFEEMFIDGAFGSDAPQNTPHTHLSILDQSRMSLFFTPEDSPFSEVLLRLANSRQEIILLLQGLDDPRLGVRLADEASLPSKLVWGVVDAAGFSGGMVPLLNERGATMRRYGSQGRLLENVIVVDGQFAIIFSQPLDQEYLDQRSGFVLLIDDQELVDMLEEEFGRLYGQAREEP